MEWGLVKPWVSALVLPPAGLLLLAAMGLLVAIRSRGTGFALAGASLLALWLLGCTAVAQHLAATLLPAQVAVTPAQLQSVQAIVVLGGGVTPVAQEYGAAQPSGATLARLRYGVRLARQTGKPLAFAGGVGWAAAPGSEPEAEVAQRVLREDYAMGARWLDSASRDTAENAQRMATLLMRDGIRRVALVTDAQHMPRAMHAFTRAGLEVVPAPTQLATMQPLQALDWVPSAQGLVASRHVLREWLAGAVAGR